MLIYSTKKTKRKQDLVKKQLYKKALERKKSGKTIGPMDTLIAAHALSASCVLITNNVKEFKNVPGLRIENWV